jgi:hypothetical protein
MIQAHGVIFFNLSNWNFLQKRELKKVFKEILTSILTPFYGKVLLIIRLITTFLSYHENTLKTVIRNFVNNHQYPKLY